MARYLQKLSKHRILSQASNVAFLVPSFRGLCMAPGTMTPLLARKTVVFSDSGFPTEARVKIDLARSEERIFFFSQES